MIATDPIADMLTQIRNAIPVNKTEVRLPHSILKEKVAQILSANNFINSVSVDSENNHKTLVLSINDPEQPAAISSLKRLSRPGRRLYVDVDRIPTVKRGRGIIIVSTSKGVMTGQEAKNKKLGGELICEVY